MCPGVVVCSSAQIVLISHCWLQTHLPIHFAPSLIGGCITLSLVEYHSHQGGKVFPKQMHFHVNMYGTWNPLPFCMCRRSNILGSEMLCDYVPPTDAEYMHLISIFPLPVPTPEEGRAVLAFALEWWEEVFLSTMDWRMAVVTGQVWGEVGITKYHK